MGGGWLLLARAARQLIQTGAGAVSIERGEGGRKEMSRRTRGRRGGAEMHVARNNNAIVPSSFLGSFHSAAE